MQATNPIRAMEKKTDVTGSSKVSFEQGPLKGKAKPFTEGQREGRPVLKVHCPNCRQTVPVLDFEATDQGLSLRCSSCHDRFFFEQPNLSQAVPENGASVCPKCFRTYRPGSESCPKCGLVFALWDQGISRVPASEEENGPWDASADILWKRILEAPEDEARHEAFLAHCRSSLCLDTAAWKYQEFLFRFPESKVAHTYRDRLVLLAQLGFQPAKKARRTIRRFTGVKIMLGLCFASVVLALVMARVLLQAG